MENTKRFMAKHWINALLLLFVGTITWFSIQYAKQYSASAKTTNDIRAIWQLAITAIAGSVGIGTIINSARSASTAAESMRVTKEKEKREQSSHLIASSSLNHFSISPPMYKNETDYKPTAKIAKYLEKIVEKDEPNDHEEYNIAARESFQLTSTDMREDRILTTDIINNLKIINIGKGVAINLEYSFDFINIDEFKDYKAISKNEEFNVVGASQYPSYNISVSKGDSLFVIEITDKILLYYAEELEMENHTIDYHSRANLVFEGYQNKSYLDYLKSGSEELLPIPNEFMILCKHYAMTIYYQKLNYNKKLSEFFKPNLKHIFTKKVIKPIGKAKIHYYNEEEIRDKSIGERKKEELIFDLHVKEESIFKQNDKLHFYLEVIPSKIPYK